MEGMRRGAERVMKLSFKHTKYACYLAYISSAVINNLAALLFVQFSRQFGLSLPQLSFTVTMNFGVQIIVDFLGAKLADRLGYRTVVMTAQAFCAVGIAGLGIFPMTFPNPYAGILTAAVLYAAGSGLNEVIISPVIEALPGDAKASSMSLLHSFYCWGHVLTAAVSTGFFYIFGIENWNILCLLWAILPIINCIMFKFVPIRQLDGGEDGEESGGILKLFGVRIMWIFFILMLCSGAAEQSMAQWASFFAETELGVSKQAADLLGPCLFAAAMGCSRVFYGIKGEKIDMKAGLLVSGLMCIASYLIAAFVPISVLSFAGCALCGFSVGLMWPGVLSLASKTYPAGGTVMFAMLALFGDMGCFLGPDTVARCSDAVSDGSVKTGLAFAIIFPVLIAVCVAILFVRKGASAKK